jgi:hypothetical protein
MFIGRYRDRPDTLKVDASITENGREGKRYSLNDFDITVWADGEVTAKRKYYATTDPHKHFPNMTVSEGAITFAIEDLTEAILARISPLELAEGLISDDETRQRMIECLAQRYASPGFNDTDRRKWLAEVKAQVHSVALDDAVRSLSALELAERSRSSDHRWRKAQAHIYRRLHEWISGWLSKLSDDAQKDFHQLFMVPDKLDGVLQEQQDPAQLESVGPQWYESRDYWREKLEEHFPAPVIPEEEKTDF